MAAERANVLADWSRSAIKVQSGYSEVKHRMVHCEQATGCCPEEAAARDMFKYTKREARYGKSLMK